MAVELERLVVLIESNTRAYERSMLRLQQQTDKAIRGASKSIGGLDKSFAAATRSAKAFGAALGVSVGVGAFRQLASSIAETVHQADDLVDLADKLGITTDALQELQYQAKQNGSSAEDLNAALDQFSKRVGQAAAGSGELLKIFQQYGIALRDANGNLRPLADLLADYAELLKSTASEQERANLAAQAFKNLDMASVFGGGADGIRKSADEAHRFNQVVGEEGLRTLSGYEQEMVRLQGVWNTAWTQMTVVTLQALEKIGQAEHFILDPVIEFLSNLKSAEQRASEAGAAAGKLIAGGRTSAAANDRINQAFGDAGIAAPATGSAFTPLDPAVLDSLSGSLNSLTTAREQHTGAIREETAAIEDLAPALEAENVAEQQLINTLDELRFSAGSALDAFAQSIANAQGPLEALKAGLVDVLQTIIRIAEQQAISKLFGAFGTAGGGILGGLLGAAPGIGSVAPARAASSQAVAVHVTATPSPLLNLTITRSSQAAEARAIARGPAVARDNSMRFAIP